METQIKFASKEAIEAPTPKSANVTFRVVLIITTVLSGFVATTGLIDESWKVEVMAVLKAVDAAVWAITRLFGEVEEK